MTTANKPVLYLGEAPIDVVIRSEESAECVGGSPLNVVDVPTNLDRPALVGAWQGKDCHEKLIEDLAAEHRVGVVPGSNNTFKTSLAHVPLDELGHARYGFDLTWRAPPLPHPNDIAHLHAGGLAATLEPGGLAVLQAIKDFSARGTVSYDPDAGPAITGSPGKVIGCIEEIVALFDVVKASSENLA